MPLAIEELASEEEERADIASGDVICSSTELSTAGVTLPVSMQSQIF